MKKLLIGLVLVICLAVAGFGIGCAEMSAYLTPATKSHRTVDYVVEQGVADASDYDGYFNLEKARRLAADLTAANAKRVQAIKHLYEDNELIVNQLRGVVDHNLEMATNREQFLFDKEKGLLSLGLTAFGLGSFTGLLGLMRKRPGDMTVEDVKRETADLREQVGIKDHQFAQVVTGVEKFFKHKDQLTSLVNSDKSDLDKVDDILAALKTHLGRNQDKSTSEAVGAVKAGV